jgi:hypothetical protein
MNFIDRWINYGTGGFHDAVTSDKNLRNVQYAAGAVAVGAATIATGGLALEAAGAAGLTAEGFGATVMVNAGRAAMAVTEMSLAEQGIVVGGGSAGLIGVLPTLPRSVGAAANITTNSRIGASPYARRLAQALSEGAQRDVDLLLAHLRAGNMNPGIGTRTLGGGFYELRGANAGRVIVKQTSAGTFDIVGKFQGHVRGKTANSEIIEKLMEDYGQ